MRSTSKLQVFVLLISGILIIAINNYLVQSSKAKKNYLPPSEKIKYFTFGYRETVADSFWLRFLQDFGTCEQNRSHLGSPLNPETGAKRGKNRVPECSMSWGYHMLNLITDLSPRFKTASEVGPLSLSVVADDIDGATLLFEKAMINLPDNWNVYYQAGYHFLMEVENPDRAVEIFTKAQHMKGATSWLPLLIARLHTQAGRKELAGSILKDLIKQNKGDESTTLRAKEKLKDLSQ